MGGNPNFNKPGDGFAGRDEKGLFTPGNSIRAGQFLVSPDDFYEKGMAYCDACEEKKVPPSIAGLCRALCVSTVTYYKYGEREEFAFEWEQVRLRMVEVWETRLFGQGTAGAQFWLKNNAGYKDTRQTELSGPDGTPITTITSVEIVGVPPPGTQLDVDAL